MQSFFLAACFFFNIGHDFTEASFEIQITDQNIEVVAEFPWSIRDALLDFNPALKQATTKQEFLTVFQHYFKQYFKLYTPSGTIIQPISIKEIKHQGHSHSTKFKILYPSTTSFRLENRLMFNYSSKQQNFHQITDNGTSIEFITHKENPTYLFESLSSKNKTHFKKFSIYYFSILLFGVFLILLRKRKNIKSPLN